MNTSGARKSASGFLYVNAGVSGVSGLVSLIKGPRLTGLLKVAGAGTQVWAGLDPDGQRLRIAAGVSAGLGAVDLINTLRPGITGKQRLFRLAGAGFNGLTAVLHNEASKDV